MSKFERNKGIRVEREFVNWLKQVVGIPAERVPLSGASRYQGEGHDINVYVFGRDAPPFVGEIKARKNGAGFTLLRRWIAGYDILFLREDHQEDLAVMPCRKLAELLAAAHSTSTQPKPKGRLEDATSGKHAPKRGDDNGLAVKP